MAMIFNKFSLFVLDPKTPIQIHLKISNLPMHVVIFYILERMDMVIDSFLFCKNEDRN